MKSLRDPNRALIAAFVGIIAMVPLIQTYLEFRQTSGVRALELFSAAPTAENLRAYEKNLETSSWAAQISRPWLQFVKFKWLKDGGEKVVMGRSGWYFYKPGLNDTLSRPERVTNSSHTNDPVPAIIDFRDQLAAHGIRLLVVPVPNKESIYPDRLTSRATSMRRVTTPRTGEILDRLQGADVEVLDLFSEFNNARLQNTLDAERPLYLAQDTHWSPAGAELAAKAAARRLTELGWIETGSIDYTERLAPVQRLGDLVRMLKSPILERSLASEAVPARQVVRVESSEIYKDQAEAEILVLGDSFMRIFQDDAPKGAGFIAHLAKELKQPLISLINDGGGSTLVREEVSARPIFLANKKIVIWEFVERDFGIGLKGWRHIRLPPPMTASKSDL